MPIDLTSTDGLPTAILRRLAPYRARLGSAEFLEEFYSDEAIATIIRDLDEYCLEHGVIGHHYTRSFADKILSEGLLVSRGVERRARFMAEHGSAFSESERAQIETSWSAYFGN